MIKADPLMIFDYQLFFGFALFDTYLAGLAQISPELRSTFIHPHYLHKLDHEGQGYLGKYLGSVVEFSTLELVQAHIYSLLRRLIADYPYEDHPLILLTVR